MTKAELFESIGIRAPKGVLLYGPPGTGKTLLARACAKNTDAIFLKLAGPQLVQMYIGDGAKLVRDAFDLAKEKITKEGRKGAIIFIDELDAIGTKRYGGEQSGDREVGGLVGGCLRRVSGRGRGVPAVDGHTHSKSPSLCVHAFLCPPRRRCNARCWSC
jgi:26S proteasome regulatory subunit T5